jgi:hypothetical protein
MGQRLAQQLRPNRRLQLTAFAARDRAVFDAIFWSAPRRQLKRGTLGANSSLTHMVVIK